MEPLGVRSTHWRSWAVALSSRRLILLVLAGALYATGTLVGTGDIGGAPFRTLIWVPSGIAVASVVLLGPVFLPFLLLGHIVNHLSLGFSLAYAAGSGLVSVLQYLLAWERLRHYRFDPALGRLRDVFLLLCWGCVVPHVLGCLPGAVLFYLEHGIRWEQIPVFALVWAARGIGGTLAIAPAFWALFVQRRSTDVLARPHEAVTLALLTTGLSLLVFMAPWSAASTIYPLSFLPYPLLIWAALRLGLYGASFGPLLVAVIAAQGTATGHGPFVYGDPVISVFLLWSYVCIMAATILLLHAVQAERRAAEAQIVAVSEHAAIRLGQDLHDGVCQQLMGVEYFCTSLRGEAKASSHLHASLGRVCEEIRGSVQSIRNVARGLSLGGIGERQLVPAFRDLAALTESMYGVSCRFDGDDDIPPLAEDAITHLYRITQEGIANAIKHGAADRISITLQRQGERLHLLVHDNGSGPDPDRGPSPGIGLKTMGYRAALFGGTVRLAPAAGRGAELACSIPLRPLL